MQPWHDRRLCDKFGKKMAGVCRKEAASMRGTALADRFFLHRHR